MDTFWSFGSLELDQFVDRKEFLGYKFLKSRIMETEQYWETKICRLHQSIHISISEIHI